MAQPVPAETWEQVLAAVEADAARTARLLSGGSPGELGEPPVLPALADMPAVPEELRERITALRDRISELQGELAYALRVAQANALPAVVAAPPASGAVPVAQFIDRRV